MGVFMGKGSKWLICVAALVIIIAGIKAASTIVVPLLVAVFISLVCAPLALGLQKRGAPTLLAVLVVVVLLISIISIMSIVVGGSMNAFIAAIPVYEAQLRNRLVDLLTLASQFDIALDSESIRENINLDATFGVLSNLLTAIGGLFANGFLILLVVVFILMEAASMPDKARVAFETSKKEPFVVFTQFIQHLHKYLLIKTLIGIATGVCVTGMATFLGVDFPVVLGLIAFLLNYIPTLGSIFAAVPAVILSLIEMGPSTSGIVAGGYVAINILLGNVLEPRFQGRGLGISPMVVFLSLVFWGWMLGIVGILLAVPLTVSAKIAFEEFPEHRWIAILLGPEQPEDKRGDYK